MKFREFEETLQSITDNTGKSERDSSGLKKDKQYFLRREELSWELQTNHLSYPEIYWKDMNQFASI